MDDIFLTSPSPLPYCIAYAVRHSDISKMFSLSTFGGDGQAGRSEGNTDTTEIELGS